MNFGIHLRRPSKSVPRGLASLCPKTVALLGCLVVCSVGAGGSVVISEIMYHPPEDRDDLQFIELLNSSASAADLSGWALDKGVSFVFPSGSTLGPGESVAVCANETSFRAHYGPEPRLGGVFKGKLSHNRERVRLIDAQQRVIDSLTYSDQPPWPLGADGYGSSLEKMHPPAAGDDPLNWGASDFQARDRAGGTPGKRNSVHSDLPLPSISEVKFDPPAPGRAVNVTARVLDERGVEAVEVLWRSGAQDASRPVNSLPMTRRSGDARDGFYAAAIPPQPEGQIVRFTLRARNTATAERSWPGPNEPRSTFSFSTVVNTNTARVPILQLISFGGMENPRPRRYHGRGGPPLASTASLRPNTSALIYLPASGKDAVLFDHVRLRPRKGGWNVDFLKHQTFEGMTQINVIHEFSERHLLAEALAYDLFRKAGVPAPLAHHARVVLDGRDLGYYLVLEQPNKSFLRRHGRDPDGNLYKILWFEHGVIGQHQKKTNPHTGHDDIVQLIEQLNRTSGNEQWRLIQQEFNVDELASYYAVNMCIQNWDGFFNNHFVYHDLRPGGKWEVFPWDEDKTWGDFDGASSRYDWYEMPLTLGMNGDDRASASLFTGRGPFGGASWWRPPGWFSGPLLANPQFRQRFLSRLREICETVFTPQQMEPAINALENKLEPEARWRAELSGQNPEDAVRVFREHIDSFRRQVVNRRKFILEELGKR